MQWRSNSTAAVTGSRAICNWDEDSLTLGVQAARTCLANCGAPAVESVTLASTTLPFADRSNATLLAGALDLPSRTDTLDATGSLRAGTTALIRALTRSSAGLALVVAADTRLARPGSPQEMEFGAGAAAVLVSGAPQVAGQPAAIATVLGVAQLAADFVDHYRLSGEVYDYALEDRWVRDEALEKLVPAAIAAALDSAQLAAERIDRLIMPGPSAVLRRVAAKSALARAQLQDNLREQCGDTGAAHSLLMLMAAIESAEPGQHLLMVGFGQGVDVVVVRIADAPRGATAHPLAATLAAGKTELHYTRYLSHTGLLDVDFGMRAERDNRTAHSVAWRKHRQITAFVGGHCQSCGTVQFPRSRVCVNPECRRTDTQEERRLADESGRVKSFTEDWQAYSPRPPCIYGNVEFAAGGNLLMELADVDAGEVSVGMQVGFVFRIKDIDRARGFRRYFWKAAARV